MDNVSVEKRSAIMSSVHSKNTRPEIFVRKLLYSNGYRYRLNLRAIPGTPDIVMKKRSVVIFVHGCFWHDHSGCKLNRMPKSHTDYWEKKKHVNASRDERNIETLRQQGWRVLVIWECSCAEKYKAPLTQMLIDFINGDAGFIEIGEKDLKKYLSRDLCPDEIRDNPQEH